MDWKSKVKHITNRILTCQEAELERKLEAYPFVSFDIFDTLIKRSVAKPVDVFRVAVQRYNRKYGKAIDPEVFFGSRITAERQARAQAALEHREEVTLEEIYRYLPEEYQKEAAALMEAELETEIGCCHADPTMKKVYQWCREREKRIFITSDMYLPRQTVERILTESGYEGYTLLLSSEQGLCKRSGHLFEVLLKQEGVEKKKLIHVGDNLRGDVLGAKKQGIASVWIANDPSRCRFTRLLGMDAQTKQQMRPIRTIMNGWIDPDWDPYYQFGFEVLGPLLYGFCTWLHENVKKEGLEKIFFLSRDGYLMQKGYRLLYGEDAIANSYLYVSRKALFIPQLWLHPEMEDVVWSLAENTVWNCEKLCDKLGLDPEIGAARWEECGLNRDQSFLSQELMKEAKVVRFYQCIREEVIRTSREAYAVFLAYLQQEGVSGRIAVVDIGWRGSMQHYLQNILTHSETWTDIHGYYVGRIQDVIPDIRLHAYIPPEAKPRVGGGGLFESLFLAREGSVKSHRMDENGMVLPVLYESEYAENGAAEKVGAYQSGALAFLAAMKTGVEAQPLEHCAAAANLYQVIRNPRKRELQMFADFCFSDGETHPLAAPKPLPVYMVKPKQLLFDFANSQWKIGFMKRLFKLPLPYWEFLHFLKKIRNV